MHQKYIDEENIKRLQDKYSDYVKQVEKQEYNNNNEILNLNNELNLVSQNKVELETLLDIEKDKNNNLNKYINNIKVKHECKIKDVYDKNSTLTQLKNEV